jgi:hypothetical protein
VAAHFGRRKRSLSRPKIFSPIEDNGQQPLPLKVSRNQTILPGSGRTVSLAPALHHDFCGSPPGVARATGDRRVDSGRTDKQQRMTFALAFTHLSRCAIMHHFAICRPPCPPAAKVGCVARQPCSMTWPPNRCQRGGIGGGYSRS